MAYDYAVRRSNDSEKQHQTINFEFEEEYIEARCSELRERGLKVDLAETLKFIELKVEEGMTKLGEKGKGTTSPVHQLLLPPSMKQGSEDLIEKVYPTKPSKKADVTKSVDAVSTTVFVDFFPQSNRNGYTIFTKRTYLTSYHVHQQTIHRLRGLKRGTMESQGPNLRLTGMRQGSRVYGLVPMIFEQMQL